MCCPGFLKPLKFPMLQKFCGVWCLHWKYLTVVSAQFLMVAKHQLLDQEKRDALVLTYQKSTLNSFLNLTSLFLKLLDFWMWVFEQLEDEWKNWNYQWSSVLQTLVRRISNELWQTFLQQLPTLDTEWSLDIWGA